MSPVDPGSGVAPTRLGRYQLLKKIAVGGMAEIYLARVSGAGGFEKDVVVKRILPQLAESDEFFKMFLDEARIAATLQHPNVVQIYDASQSGSEFFIAMEYLDGADLLTVRRVLAERREGLPIQHSVYIVSSVAAGLHYAHEKRGLDGAPLHIVHRDVTPQNIFLTRDGSIKLVDFGIAKAANRISSTSYGTLKGKLAYMSPEQCRAESVDRRSDIYSLGILLYELTTGKRLYRGKSEYELLREIVEGQVEPPSSMMDGYPVDLEALVMRALARDREERYQTALVFQQELERFTRRHAVVGSALDLAEFLAPLLDEAQRQSEARRRRMSTSPPYESIVTEGPERDAAPIAEETHPEPAGARRRARSAGERQARPDTVSQPGNAEDTVPGPRPSASQALRTRPAAVAERAVPATIPIPPDPGLDGIRLRRSAVGPIVALLVIGALGAGGVALWQAEHAAAPAMDAGTAPAPPAEGSLSIDSEPSGAAVWLALGPAPLVTMPLDPGRSYLLRLEHEGYRPREVRVDPSSFHEVPSDPGGVAREAEVLAQLEPTGDDDPSPVLTEPTAMPDAVPAGARSGRIRIATEPVASQVWLLIGISPTRFAPVATAASHEVRLARDGYLPAFVTVAPAQFGATGEARTNAALEQRREPPRRR